VLKNSIKSFAISIIERAYKIDRVRNCIFKIQKENGHIMLMQLPDHRISFEYFDYIGRQIYQNGEYQRPLMRATMGYLRSRGLLPEGGVMIEVGANIGTHTIYASLEHDFERIISLEPDPRSFEFLEMNIALNNLSDKAEAFQVAAGSHNSLMKFKQEERNRGFSRITSNNSSTVEMIEVEVVAIDDFLSKIQVMEKDINFFWIDVEGYELNVLKGMEKVLSSTPSICMEFSPSLYSSDTQEELVDLIFANYSKVHHFNSGQLDLINSSSLKNSTKNTDLLLTRA